MSIIVQSPAFNANAPIPRKYSAEDADASPPLRWTGVPAGAKELALICDDPDAPQPQPWVHWVLYKLPATLGGLPERIAAVEKPAIPGAPEAVQGRNSSGQPGYGGPYPPRGHGVHHYHFTLYALDAALSLTPGLDEAALLKAIKGHVLDKGELIGTYKR